MSAMEDLKHRCIYRAYYKRIDGSKLRLEHHEIGTNPRDMRSEFEEPVVAVRDDDVVVVSVYDEEAVDLENRGTLFGDASTACYRCENELDKHGFDVVLDNAFFGRVHSPLR